MIQVENQVALVSIPDSLPSLLEEEAIHLLSEVNRLLPSGIQGILFILNQSEKEPPLSSYPIESLQRQMTKLSTLFMKLEQSGIPLAVLISGTCDGTRFALATLCHLRIGIGSTSTLEPGSPFENRFPIAGTSLRLTHLHGLAKTIQWIFVQQSLSAEKALSLSYLQQLVTDVKTGKHLAFEWIEKQNPPLAPPVWYSKMYPLWNGEVNQFTWANAHIGGKIETEHHPARFVLAALYHGLHLPFEKGVRLEEKYIVKALSQPC